MNPTDTAKLLLDAKSRINLSKRKDWQALYEMRKYENALIRAGMTLCPDCQGRGEIKTQIAYKLIPCDWCSGTGYDDERHKTCWQCNGRGEYAIDQFAVDTCKMCGGSRVIPCKENSTKGATV